MRSKRRERISQKTSPDLQRLLVAFARLDLDELLNALDDHPPVAALAGFRAIQQSLNGEIDHIVWNHNLDAQLGNEFSLIFHRAVNI